MLSWKYADNKLLATCPKAINKSVNNAVLNPLNKETKEYIKALINDLVSIFFPKSLNIKPILHLGGEEPSYECWKEDVVIS